MLVQFCAAPHMMEKKKKQKKKEVALEFRNVLIKLNLKLGIRREPTVAEAKTSNSVELVCNPTNESWGQSKWYWQGEHSVKGKEEMQGRDMGPESGYIEVYGLIQHTLEIHHSCLFKLLSHPHPSLI